jgi:hypothetical protein
MTNQYGLRVKVKGDGIVIALPKTSFEVTYRKSDDKRRLIATSRSGRWEPGTLMTQAEFHARAWTAANDKARELGWIV